MRIALIGATGFVGSYLIDAFVAAGYNISALVRPGSEGKLRHRENLHVVAGDVSSQAQVEATLSGCDTAVYCVGILREAPRLGVTFETLQYEGAVRTIEAAKRAGVQRFLLMSANGVKTPGTAYQETKKRTEDALLASGLDATVFRPSVIFGDPRGRMEFATQLHRDLIAKPIPAIAFFTGLNPARGQVQMSPVHVEDVAKAFTAALANRETVGHVYNLGGPEVLSWTEMLRRIAAAAGRRKWIVPYPLAVMKLAATLFDWLPFFPVTRDQLSMLAEGNTCDPGVLEALIDAPPRPFAADTLSYLKNSH